MFDDLLEQVLTLKGQDKPFVQATVVACRPPTSAKPGAKAIVQADGSFYGWVGGSCAQPLVVQESLKALGDGAAPGSPAFAAPRGNGLWAWKGWFSIPMTCQSEGTLAIYLEPYLPKPQLVVVGNSPMARSLVSQGAGLGFRVTACDPFCHTGTVPGCRFPGSRTWRTIKDGVGPRSHVVVATMGHYDEEALEAVMGCLPSLRWPGCQPPAGPGSHRIPEGQRRSRQRPWSG